MPVETLRPHDSRLPAGPFTPAMSFRLLNKGPDYFRRRVVPGPRLSAVERLEADKAKYVKSQQVALTRQAPVKPPIIRKPLLSPGMVMQCRVSTPPARRFPRRPGDAEQGGGMGGGGARRGPPLNLEILNNLINNVCEAPLSSPSSYATSPDPSSSSATSPDPSSSSSASPSSPSSGAKSIGSSLSAEQERSGRHPASSCTSSCTSPLPPPSQAHPEPPARCPPPVPARGLRPGPPAPYSAPNSVTVRRVDVRPHEVRKPLRPPLLPKPQPQPQHQPQHQPKHQPLIKPRQIAQPQAPPPLQLSSHHPIQAPPPPPPSSHPLIQAPPPYPPPSPRLPPASPAFTRLSSSSSRGSRKHPSLHRSKSDLSDRYSRATADLERFFNYCGLDPRDLDGGEGGPGGRLARAASDIVSVSKMRSVSTPSSEYGECRQEEEGEEEVGMPRASERVPYGISVIERNARVIKWLYGIRQARDSAPETRDSAPLARDSAPQARDSAPQARDSAPQARDSAPLAKDSTPQARDSAPPARDSAPQARDCTGISNV